MDRGVVRDQTFLGRVVEVCAVVDCGLFAGGAAEDFGTPGVQVGVEVEDCDGAVGAGDAAEEGERDCVVASEGDEAGERFVFGGEADFFARGCGGAG